MPFRARQTFAVVSLLSGLFAAACSAPPPAPLCVPGKSEACVGAGGCQGAQVCSAEGNSFGACQCEAPDAGMDAGYGDAGFAMPLDTRFVASEWVLASSASELASVSVDVDGKSGDGNDNQLGVMFVALSSFSAALRDELTSSVDTGSFNVLFNVQTETPPDGRAILFVYSGKDPAPDACADANDTICRRHLDGQGSFTAMKTPAGSPGLPGSLTSASVSAGPGTWEVPMRIGQTDLVLPVQRARVVVTMQSDSLSDGKVGGALPMSYVQSTLHPALADFARTLVSRDCTSTTPPDCGCTSGSAGQELLSMMDDSPQDCVVSDAEWMALPVGSEPDIDLDQDGTNDALSFGFGFRGVPAQYTVP